MKKPQVSVNKDVFARIREVARQRGVWMSEIVAEALEGEWECSKPSNR